MRRRWSEYACLSLMIFAILSAIAINGFDFHPAWIRAFFPICIISAAVLAPLGVVIQTKEKKGRRSLVPRHNDIDQSHPSLRHMLATLAYRGTRAIAGAPDNFAGIKASPSGRSALEILSHINDLLNWIGWIARGAKGHSGAKPHDWKQEIATFYERLKLLDDWLATNPSLQCDPNILFQGPVADVLTHIGQLAMLRRLAAYPIRAEDYSAARISIGNVGPDQAAPVIEFD